MTLAASPGSFQLGRCAVPFLIFGLAFVLQAASLPRVIHNIYDEGFILSAPGAFSKQIIDELTVRKVRYLVLSSKWSNVTEPNASAISSSVTCWTTTSARILPRFKSSAACRPGSANPAPLIDDRLDYDGLLAAF